MRGRKLVGIDLQQAAGLGRLGPQARADLGHDETLLAADVQGLDHGHLERSALVRFWPAIFSNSTTTVCAALAGSNNWAVIFCTVDPAAGGSTDHCRTLGSKTLTTLNSAGTSRAIWFNSARLIV